MRRLICLILFMVSSLVGFTYWVALSDWLQQMKTAMYEGEFWKAFLEIVALVSYTALAIRFMIRSRIV